ncbi:MAG: hypothetical protein J6125_01910, partial [Clostridia bacterium]|nr:hypothetical protein [Clostridia bacterium]
SSWGVTMKRFKEEDSSPEFLDYRVHDPQSWADAKARMTPSRDRVNWKNLDDNYASWRAEGQWVEAEFWFGFDVAHSWMAGTENILCALIEEPEWVTDIFDTYLSMCIAEFEMIWDAGYRFDSIRWPDDMGYKGTTFFSPAIYRELLKPFHKKAVDWAHERGVFAHLHSCGDIMTLLPDVVDTGIDCLNPLEIKAGMDGAAVKERYGDRLALHGGINAALWDKPEQFLSEIDRLLPSTPRAADTSLPPITRSPTPRRSPPSAPRSKRSKASGSDSDDRDSGSVSAPGAGGGLPAGAHPSRRSRPETTK